MERTAKEEIMKKKYLFTTLIFLITAFCVSGVFALEHSVYDSVRDRIISAYSYTSGTNYIAIEVSDSSGALINAADLALTTNPEVVTTNSLDLDFSLAYNPTTAQAYISYTYFDVVDIHTVAVMDLSPVGAPVLFVNPTALDFGPVTIGNAPSLNVTVQNTGDGTINVTGVTGPSTPYSMTNGCNGASLTSQQTCIITIQFTPTAVSTFNDTLQVNTSEGPQTVTITGVGQAAPTPQISVSPTTVNFSTVTVGSNTTSNVQVTNIGTADLNVSFVGSFTPAQFTLASNGCSGPVTPGNFCTISVRFTPSAEQAYSGSFQINSDGGNQQVALNGAGQSGGGGGNIDLQPTDLITGTGIWKGAKKTLKYTIRNNGSSNSGPYKIRIYLSPCIALDGTICNGGGDKLDDGKTVNVPPDVVLYSETLSSLPPGGQVTDIPVQVTNPTNLTTHGRYYYILMVDPDFKINETNENNNTRFRGGDVV